MSTQASINWISKDSNFSMANEWFEIANVNHFWMQWRFNFFKKFLPFDFQNQMKGLEIGCGSGVFRQQFESFFKIPLDGFETNREALLQSSKGLGELNYYDITERRPEFKEKYDIVFLMDVLEHIDDDSSFLEDSLYYLKPGGHIILNVPSCSLLFSKYDIVAGHKRLYSHL